MCVCSCVNLGLFRALLYLWQKKGKEFSLSPKKGRKGFALFLSVSFLLCEPGFQRRKMRKGKVRKMDHFFVEEYIMKPEENTQKKNNQRCLESSAWNLHKRRVLS